MEASICHESDICIYMSVCKHYKQEFSYCGSTGSLLKHVKVKHVFVDLSGQSSTDDDDDDGATGCMSDSEPTPKHQIYFIRVNCCW